MLTTFASFYGWEGWAIAAVVFIVLFGGTKIPQLAKGLGEGIREFKKSVIDEEKPESERKSGSDGETK